VRRGDGPDDGEAEAVTVALVGAVAVEALERFEETVDLSGRDDRPRVPYGQQGAAAAGPGRDGDASRHLVVAHGVVDQVGDEPFEEERVPLDQGGSDRGLDVQAQPADAGAGSENRPPGDGREIDGFVVIGPGFAVGEGEERLDETRLLVARGEQLVARGSPPLGARLRAREGDLEQGALRGERRPKLV